LFRCLNRLPDPFRHIGSGYPLLWRHGPTDGLCEPVRNVSELILKPLQSRTSLVHRVLCTLLFQFSQTLKLPLNAEQSIQRKLESFHVRRPPEWRGYGESGKARQDGVQSEKGKVKKGKAHGFRLPSILPFSLFTV
jgi:hypothetical protein